MHCCPRLCPSPSLLGATPLPAQSREAWVYSMLNIPVNSHTRK